MCCDPDPVRKRIALEGQSIDNAFSQFVTRCAKDHDLCGFLNLKQDKALIEVEGDGEAVESFIHDLSEFEPVASLMENMQATDIPLYGGGGFSVNQT